MNATTQPAARIAVIGGGISGLTAAYRLRALRPELHIELWEANDRLGGVLRTVRDGGYLLEESADSFLRGPTAPWAEKLCEEIGLADQLIATHEQHRGAHIYWNGRLHAVPAGFQLLAPTRLWPILSSRLLSPLGRVRLCLEPLIPERQSAGQADDESLAAFAERRVGREAFERIVQPLVSGIYTADPNRLSVAAALPHWVNLVREHGSLYRGMRQQERQTGSREAGPSRAARYGLFVTLRGGMGDLVDALAARLDSGTIRLNTRVKRIVRLPNHQWQLQAEDGVESGAFQAVILALPTWAAAQMLDDLSDARLANELRTIEYAGSAVVCMGYRKDQIRRRLDAFGCVVPAASRRKIVAISYSSVKFPHRAPAGRELLRVFVGGALQGDLAELPERQLIDLVRGELSHLLGVEGEPEICHVVRWPRGMPQYHLGHLNRVTRIHALLRDYSGLYLASNGLDGVGIPQCIRRGSEVAEQIVEGIAFGDDKPPETRGGL